MLCGLAGLLVAHIVARKKSDVDNHQLIIFHAGSLAVPFKQICEQFRKCHPDIKIICEAAGSRLCARKISDLKRACDVMASADYTVIETLLIGKYADWNIKFASNEIVIAFLEDSCRAGEINRDNWCDILLDDDVAFGRSDPNSDPCGYRTVFTAKLAGRFYGRPDFAGRILAKDRKFIRPKEVDLLAFLEVKTLDYVFIYRSVAQQHKLKYLVLPDEINLKKVEFADFYKSASIRVTGKKPRTFITKTATPIVYGVTIPKNAPNREAALEFLAFLLDADKGGAILEQNGQNLIVPSPTDTYGAVPGSLKRFAKPAEKERNESI